MAVSAQNREFFVICTLYLYIFVYHSKKSCMTNYIKPFKYLFFFLRLPNLIFMTPPFRVGRHIVFPQAAVCLSQIVYTL